MRKGLIILGGQGVGKTRLAESIAQMYKAKDVGRFEATEQWLYAKQKLNIIEGVSLRTPMPRTIRRPYAAESEDIKHHRFILISSTAKEENITQDYLEKYNVITLK